MIKFGDELLVERGGTEMLFARDLHGGVHLVLETAGRTTMYIVFPEKEFFDKMDQLRAEAPDSHTLPKFGDKPVNAIIPMDSEEYKFYRGVVDKK